MKKNKHIIATLFLLILSGSLFWIAAEKYYTLERQACLEQLTGYTRQLGNEIKNTYLNEQAYLQQIAELFTQYDLQDYSKMGKSLSMLNKIGMISRYEILFPEDQILTKDGILIDGSSQLTFQKEASLGIHISRRTQDFLNQNHLILRHYVPIVQNGITKAILCGIIELDNLPHIFSVEKYGETMNLYIVEGNTGNFLQDTWHDELTTISNLGTRQTKKGYDWNQFISDTANGKASTIVFLSQTSGEYFYAYTEPVGVEDWMITLNVSEKEVFSHAKNVLYSFYFLAGLFVLSFMLYFIWILWDIHNEKLSSEKQLQNVQYLLEVEKELFHAHLLPEHFSIALQKVAKFLTAETTFFCLSNKKTNVLQEFWSNHKNLNFEQDPELLNLFSNLLSTLYKKKSFITYNMEDFYQKFPDISPSPSKTYHIRNLMLVPIVDLNDEIYIILGACNMKHRWKNTKPLEQVSLIFSKAINHYEIHQMLSQMGQMDSLTGLLNRNSYHIALDTLSTSKLDSFACIYIDTNGLHEINNHLGHKAGDKMLQTVARALKRTFCESKIYRIGGDEFVILCQNQSKKDIEYKADFVRQQMNQQNYSISIGIEWKNSDIHIDDIVNAAETTMQENKRLYYKKNGKERQLRSLNYELEQILLEKQDADTFLNFLAPEFKGVYFVDLNKDSMRHLYIPLYFEEILKETESIFSQALRLYALRLVKPEYYHEFELVCDYTYLKTQLENNITPAFAYQKIDGSWLTLRILKFKTFTNDYQETLWIFTNTNNTNMDDNAINLISS